MLDSMMLLIILHVQKQHCCIIKFLHPICKNGEVKYVWPRKHYMEECHPSAIFFGPIRLEGCGDFTVPNLMHKAIEASFAIRS